MIGVDLTTIERFKNASLQFAHKILHVNEMNDYINDPKPEIFLATRWAIKEALYKIDNSLFEFNKINIKKNNLKYIFSGFSISTSIENGLVIAIAHKGCK